MIGPPLDDRVGPIVIVLPAHDEAPTVAGVVELLPSNVAGRRVEVVVVDDGSTDDTRELALAAGAKVVTHDHRLGLGAALRTGFSAARAVDAWAVAFLDADGEYDPRELPAILAPIVAGDADYVVGTRFGGTIESMLPLHRLGNRALTALTSLAVGRRLTDAQSGYRALSREALAAAHIAHDYNYAQVLTIDLLGKGFRYCEVPIRYRRRAHGRSFVTPGRYLLRVLPAMLNAMRAVR